MVSLLGPCRRRSRRRLRVQQGRWFPVGAEPGPAAYDDQYPAFLLLTVAAIGAMGAVGFQGWRLLRQRGVFKKETFPSLAEITGAQSSALGELSPVVLHDRWWPDAPEFLYAELTGRRLRASQPR